MKGYYGDNVKNITLLHGKNGAGKSTLLNLLGMRLDDRRNSHRKENRRSYFLMYHLYHHKKYQEDALFHVILIYSMHCMPILWL